MLLCNGYFTLLKFEKVGCVESIYARGGTPPHYDLADYIVKAFAFIFEKNMHDYLAKQ